MKEVKDVERGYCPLTGYECLGAFCEWSLCNHKNGDLYCAVTAIALAIAKKCGDKS